MADLLAMFRTDIGKARARLKSVREDLEKARNRRDELLAQPPAVDECCDGFMRLFDERAQEWKAMMAARLSHHLKDLHGKTLNPGTRSLSFHEASRVGFDTDAILVLMGRDKVREVVKSCILGLGLKHRAPALAHLAEIQRLAQTISDLEGQEKAITAELDAFRREMAD